MSWTDKRAIETIKQLRDYYEVTDFVETGTFMGINARLQANNFDFVFTCEKVPEYHRKALDRLVGFENVTLRLMDSPEFLSKYIKEYKDQEREDTPIFYLDAHFYDPKMPKGKGKFVVLKELQALKGFNNSIVIIHDFDNGLGHCNYDGIRLDMDLVREDIKKVNPNFNYYTNRLESCDIYTPETILDSGMEIDFETMDNIRYANKEPRLKFRGILYALPSKLSDEHKESLGLREWK
jgi:hypothetical protein